MWIRDKRACQWNTILKRLTVLESGRNESRVLYSILTASTSRQPRSPKSSAWLHLHPMHPRVCVCMRLRPAAERRELAASLCQKFTRPPMALPAWHSVAGRSAKSGARRCRAQRRNRHARHQSPSVTKTLSMAKAQVTRNCRSSHSIGQMSTGLVLLVDSPKTVVSIRCLSFLFIHAPRDRRAGATQVEQSNSPRKSADSPKPTPSPEMHAGGRPRLNQLSSHDAPTVPSVRLAR